MKIVEIAEANATLIERLRSHRRSKIGISSAEMRHRLGLSEV